MAASWPTWLPRPRKTCSARLMKKGVQRGFAPLPGVWGCPPDINCPLPGQEGGQGDGRKSFSTALADIPHISLRVSKGPAILHDGDGRGIHERRQLSHRAHKTISRCRELASARQRRQLSARLHTLQLIQAHSSPLAILVTADGPKDTRYPGAGWSPPIRSSTCRNTSRGTAPSAS